MNRVVEIDNRLISFRNNGELHRLHGPAVIWFDGYRLWWKSGIRHRKDGPAVIFPDGSREWWENGKLLKEKRSIRYKVCE